MSKSKKDFSHLKNAAGEWDFPAVNALVENIRAFVVQKGLKSQASIGSAISYDQSNAGKLMRKAHLPSLERIQVIADKMGIQVWEIFMPRAHKSATRAFAERQLMDFLSANLTDTELVNLIDVVKTAARKKGPGVSPKSNVTTLGVYFRTDQRNRDVAVPDDRREQPAWTEHPVEEPNPRRPMPPWESSGENSEPSERDQSDPGARP